MVPRSPFKTVDGQTEFLAAYDAAMELWSVPYEEVTVTSRFGTTHVVVSGPEGAPPLVLLHGTMTTLLMWLPNVEDLSKGYRVFAIDTMGHPSKSVPDEPIGNAADFAEWLASTLEELSLDRVALAGISHGGWVALNFAVASPERVEKLILLAPAASFEPISKRFLLRTMLSFLPPRHRRFVSMMRWMGLEETPGDKLTGPLLDLMWLGGTHFRMPPETRRVMGNVFSDDELRSLPMPVLLLIGQNEVVCDPTKALSRAERVIPEFEGDLIPGGRHAMSFNQNELVDARMLEFLQEQRGRSRP
jgi:pimeloyl-ACP methyl ester carboxylesterase